MELSSKMKEIQVVVEMRLSVAIFKEIQQKTGHDRKFVHKWLKKWHAFGSIQDCKRTGAPKKISSQNQKKKLFVH